ncbi:MAG: YdeI/OmpD-associated family protein [Cyanobacteria bacterium P01_H01_bin.121]
MQDFKRVEIQSVEELRAWFEANHDKGETIWLVTYKKAVPEKYVSIQEVLDEVLCFGWLDGRRMKLDAERTMQLLSPRRTGHWAKTYKDHVASLEQAGRMHPAGRKAVETAKQNGLWNFMDDVDALIVPADLAEALAARPLARDYYEAFPDSAKRDILRWIKLAKKAETRTQRIEQTAKLAAQNQRASGTR